MGSWTGTPRLEGAGGGIGDMLFVIRRICALAIPTGWKNYRNSPAATAGGLREPDGVFARTRRASRRILLYIWFTSIAQTSRHFCSLTIGTITDQHTEALSFYTAFSKHLLTLRLCSTYRFEGCDLGVSLVPRQVIDSHPCVDIKKYVCYLRYPLERAIARAEVQVGSPVVGEILRVGATSARRCSSRVDLTGFHRGVEGVTSSNLVHMLRRQLVRVDQGVNTVDGELGATETHYIKYRLDLCHHRSGADGGKEMP